MSCGIYKITNLKNNKSYIGQSIYIEKRWSNEKASSKNPNDKNYNTALSKALRKHGIENFNFKILEICDKEDLSEREIHYIDLYNSYFNGYNETSGGEGVPNISFKLTQKDIDEIYDLLLNSDLSQKEIAEKFNVGKDVISTINHGKSRRQINYTYPLRDNSNKKYCIDCGKLISYTATRCLNCEKIRCRKVNRPSREELKQMIRNLTFTSIASKYSVSDNTIRKWCDYYSLPRNSREIKKISKEDWDLI